MREKRISPVNEFKMKIRRSPYNPTWFILIASLMLVAGCAGVQIRASDSMLQENSIKKIAVLSTARVEWPRYDFIRGPTGKEPVLGLTESKQALAILTPKLRDILVDKGYEVVFSEPMGIGYYSPRYKENLVIETYGEKGKQFKKGQITDNSPAFEYPVVQNDQRFGRSVRNLFEHIELAGYRRDLETFTLPKNDLEVIREVTGADTVCLYRVYGQKFSTSRKVATTFLSLSGPVKDIVVSFWFFVDASSGEVLWQHGRGFIGKDPTNPEEMGAAIDSLKYLPKISKTMDPRCKKKGPAGSIYECPK
jgi:hypothetical protein